MQLSAVINGSAVDLSVDVSLVADSGYQWSSGSTGYFERSSDGITFSVLHSTAITGTVALTGTYTHTDSTGLSSGNTYYYRFRVEATQELVV